MADIAPLPASVKIGHRTYKIEDWNPRGSVAAHRYGECSHLESTIRVATIYGSVNAGETLLHEIMHAAWCFVRLQDADDEESTVGPLANALSAVWIDNPGVMDWIKGALLSGDQ